MRLSGGTWRYLEALGTWLDPVLACFTCNSLMTIGQMAGSHSTLELRLQVPRNEASSTLDMRPHVPWFRGLMYPGLEASGPGTRL